MGMLDEFNSPVSMVFGKPGEPISKEDLDAFFCHVNDGSFEEFYSRVDAKSVAQKIESFKAQDYGEIDDKRLDAEIRSLMVDGESLISFPEEIALPPRAVLFRARALSDETMEEYLNKRLR